MLTTSHIANQLSQRSLDITLTANLLLGLLVDKIINTVASPRHLYTFTTFAIGQIDDIDNIQLVLGAEIVNHVA